MRALVSYLLISFIAFGVSNAAVINVPEDHETIQEAINASQNGDTVLVAPGEYTENINLIGRDISLIGNPNNPAETMIFAAEDGSVITYSRGETRNSILSGFTISGGTGNQIDDQHYGGGIFILDSSPSIDHCIILNNHVDYGGGAIVCLTGRPRIDFCLIYSNSSDNYGGAFFIDWEAWPEIWDCTIIGNQAENSGGGYFLQRGSRSHIFSSIFWQNEPQEIFLGAGNGNRVQIYFSTIMNGMDGIVLGNGGFASLDEGSTDMDPLFVDPDSHDYRPRWDSFPVDDDEKSPCIDGAHYRSPSDPDDTRSDIGAQYFDQGEPSQMYFDPSMLIIEEPGEYVINISTEGDRSLYWQLTPDVDWLRVEPTEGLMYPEQDIDVFVLVIEEQLERGRYTTDLIFRANNPNEREFVVETILYYEGGRPPRWEILPDEFLIIEGDQISFELEGIDPGGEEVSMRMARGNLPRSGQFTDNGDGTGSFNWQTSHFDSGQYNPEFILTDGVYLITAEVPIIVEDYMQEFDLNTPPNGSEIDDLLSIDFNWNSASREPEIEDVSYKLHLRRPDSTVVVVLAADTAIAVGTELISRNHDSDINIRWEVWAYDGFDSLRCSEQFEFVFPPLGINPDNQFFIPELLTLHGSFPNPFNSSTIVRFSIGRATDIHIGLYGIDGKIISPLHSGAYNVGNYQLKLNLPSNLPSGIYLLRFRAEQTIMHQRIVLIR